MKSWLYRTIMKIAHKYHWHYAPPVYPDGDTMLWCQWCGFRAVVNGKGINDGMYRDGEPCVKTTKSN